MREITDKSAWRHKVASVATFKYLSPVELDILLDNATLLQLDEDDSVVHEGDLSPYFFAILGGIVNVSVAESTLDGSLRDVFICALGPGDVFGEAGIFMKMKRTASVSAASEATVLRLHRNDISSFMKSQPAGGNKFLLVIIHSLLRKLRAANQELAYERKADMDQADVDSLLADMMGG